MKLLKYIGIATILISTMGSCKQEYLDTAPTASTGPDVVFGSIENARGAVNGLSRLMKRQYISSQGFNGEGTIKMYYGNYSGNHLSIPLPGWSSVTNIEYISNPLSTYVWYPWFYYYTIIGNANTILDNIDDVQGADNEKAFLKAQTLTFRAYSYMMLAQLYGDRWSDSNNGATEAVILRTEDNLDDLPLSSLSDTYGLIYDDLSEAISLYESASSMNRSHNYEVNIDVAHAIYARAALNREDYPTAERYAALAKQGYSLMDVAAYNQGFANPTSEWIWSVFDTDDETIYFYSFGAYMGYNSTSSQVRLYPRSISKDLYESLPVTDIRRNMFLDPADAGTYNAVTGQGDATALSYIRGQYPNIQSNQVPFAYMQFKFSVNGAPGISHIPNFRTSEMLLVEAEAKYFQQKPASEIQALLNILTQSTGRDPNYNCTATGTALLEEIKKYRAIELWGEGYDFFDLKRWGDPISRTSFEAGGNFQDVLAVDIQPSERNKWKLVIPQRETDYNTLID